MTIDQILHKLRTAFLGLVLALSLFMPTSTWADSFITDVILVGGTSDEVSSAKKSYSGYSYINFDLNSGAGGDYIYLGYKTSASANLNGGYITDFIIIDAGSSKSPPSSLTYNSRTYYRTSAYGGSHFRDVYGNLNSNSGGWNLYLYYTWSNFSDKRAVSSISINSTKSGSINAYNTSGSLVESQIDLNRGISGSTDVYMHIYTSTKKHRLSSAPVMASGLVYNGQPQRLIKTAASSSGTVYYKVGSGSYTSTVSSITATSAGSYTVYYYVGSNSYADASGEQSKTVTIAKSPNSSASVYIASTLYADQAISPSISGTNLSKGSITYKYATSQNGSYSTTIPLGEGTYWVKATISGDGNCYEYTTSPRQFSVIKRQNSNATVNITSSIVYGETLNPTVTGNQSTGSVTYKYATSQNGSFSTTKPTEVGTYWVKATIASNSYYYEYTTSARSFEITPKEISIIWDDQTSFVYNGTDQAPTATAGSLVSGDECLITVQGAKDVGKQTATATALSNGNYKLPADVEKPFEITPKEINIIWGEQTSFVYNGTDQAPTATAGSLVAGDECVITVSGAEKNVGKHIATATALSNDNYKLPADVEQPFEITKAPLTISAKNKTITYGDEPADNGVEYSGFVGEDDASVLGGTLMFSTDYEQNGPIGEYAITPSNLTSDNYEIEFVNGSLTVEPKEVSITWGDALLHYNGTEQAPTATAEGLVNGDKCSVVVSGAAKDIGKYSAFVTGLSNNNYKLPTENLEISFEIAINLAALNENFIAQDGYVLKGALGGNYKVSIAEGATVTLDGVTINGVNNFAYKWAGITCVGDCNIVLAENSVNTVKGFDCDYPGIYVPEGKTLTISGPGSLDASSNGQGAGIGGGWGINCGNIVISGGSVKSTGGTLAAGIGGGNHGSVGNITISGGTVESTGGTDAAGIGGGNHGSVNDITISGGVVAATGGVCGAGIGGGDYYSSVGNITISGGSVKSTGGSLAAGIGGGSQGSVGNITITDDVVKVTATKGSSAQYSVGVGRYGSRTGVIAIGGKEYEDIETSPFVYLRKLTVTAKNKTIVYGDEPSDNGVEYAGFLDGDDLSVLSGTLSLSTDYKRNGLVGDYPITPSGLTSDKYNVVFESGTLTVEPKEVSIAWGEQTSFVYNGTEQAPTATVEGLVDGDECSVVVSGAAKDFGKHTATASVSCSDNYKLPTENLEKAFEIAYTNLALLNADYIAQDGEVLTETLAGNYKISIADGATVTLDGVTIKGEDDEAYSWAGITCEGDCNIVLAEKSVNKVNGFYKNYPGIYVPEGKTLTISGTGSIDASSNGAGAGIGCGYDINCGNIVISDGSVTATGGGYASGIGSGEESTAGSITLTENVTKVTAIKGDNAIFSVYSGGLTETVTIGSFKTICVASSPFVFTGEAYTVVYDANGGDGTMGKQVLYFGLADILYANKFTRDGFSFVGWNTKADGSGESYTDKALIDIAAGADGVVTLYAQWWNGNLLTLASDYIAQDGDVLTGTLGGNYQISIADGATVTLDGVTINGVDDDAYRWAGISCLGDCNIVLAEKSVNTVKGFYRNYPGIYVPKGGTLTISGSGSLNVSSNGNAAGIGGGLDFWCGNIVIGGGTITAMGGEGAAGIGGGHGFECGNIVISGGSITATGGEGASGIGSGDNGTVGNITITDGVTKVIATKGDDASSIGVGRIGTRTGTITIGGTEYGDIEASPFVYPTTIAEYPAVQVYEYSRGIRAIINADYTGKETLSVPTPIEVDSVEVTRALTPLTPATTVLPFKLPDGTTLNAMFYYLKEVVQEGCSWNATMKYIGEGNLPQANTPYAVILNKGESKLKFDMHGKQATVQTGKIADGIDETGKWYFKGLYSYRVWRDTDKGEDNEIGLAYGFAGSNEDGVAKGEFGRIVDGAYAVPMRSYLRKANASVRLNCNASAPARVKGLVPYQANYASAETGVINVRFVEEDDSGVEKTTAVGRMNAATGEIQIDRWYDLKGRRVNNVKRAAKGAYYGKKVLKK